MTFNAYLRRPWMLTGSDLRKDAPYFVTVGGVLGLVQWMSYRTLDHRNWGSELLQEHVAFYALAASILSLATVRIAMQMRWIPRRWALGISRNFTIPVSARAVAFASVAASVILGFALSVALCGSFSYALKFLQVSVYFASLAELAANLGRGQTLSKAFDYALGIVISMPFLF